MNLQNDHQGNQEFFSFRDSYPVTKRFCISCKDVHQGCIKSSVPKAFWTNWVGSMYKSRFGTRINSLVVFFLEWVFCYGFRKKMAHVFLKFTYLWGEMYLSYICFCLMRYWKAIHFARSIRHVAKRWNSAFELLNWSRTASFHWRKDPCRHFIE